MESEAIGNVFVLVVEGVDPWRVRSGGGPAPYFFSKAGIRFLGSSGPVSARPTRDTTSIQTNRTNNDYYGGAGTYFFVILCAPRSPTSSSKTRFWKRVLQRRANLILGN